MYFELYVRRPQYIAQKKEKRQTYDPSRAKTRDIQILIIQQTVKSLPIVFKLLQGLTYLYYFKSRPFPVNGLCPPVFILFPF